MIAFFNHISRTLNAAVIAVLVISPLAFAEQASMPESGLPVLTPEQLESYQFQPRGEEVIRVTDLNVGQRAIMNSQRRLIKDLMTRRLGILNLKRDRTDLRVIQSVVDRELIRPTEVREWQALGVVFGDVLATEFDLHWVSYEDDRGIAKALRWRDTENYVFPVTMLSKRVYFKEDIIVNDILQEIGESVNAFKRFESLKPN